VSKIGRYALAFGTGDRENLWKLPLPSSPAEVGRFYVIVDDGFTRVAPVAPAPIPWWATPPLSLPLTESIYPQILPSGGTVGTNLLETGPRGWYMLLDNDERVITKAFGLSGILIFSSFQPEIGPPDADELCARTGLSRNFVVFTRNGDPVTSLSIASAVAGGDPDDPPVDPTPNTPERFLTLPDFVTSPFVEQTQTQNFAGGQAPPEEGTDVGASCSDDLRLNNLVEVLKDNGPSNSRYANFFLRIGQRMSQQGVFYPACVPIAVQETNWKEN
jgi:hypothetical protein